LPDFADMNTADSSGPMPGTPHQILWQLARLAIQCFFTPFFELRVTGARYLPRKNAVVVLPKHQRWQDIPLLAMAAPRPLYYVAKYELFRQTLINRSLVALGGIPLNRRQPLQSRQSFKKVVALLKCNQGVVLFPEGTYYPDCMGAGRIGMLRYILERVKVPLVPVGIRYHRRKWRTRVWIQFGKPVSIDPLNPIDAVLNRIMQEIARLSGL
jgi:1-acyl-sn-glycerol-3-phosphate acyltransferase